MSPTIKVMGFVGLLALSLARSAAAAESDTLETAVPGVEVTALRGNDRISDIPAATFVLSREALRRSAAVRISTLLQTLPGFYGYRQTSDGEPGVVDPRGFSASGESSYLKLLVDGQDSRDIENGNVDWDWMPPEDIERVEVVQGAGAWAYGDGSEGGIVNIVRANPTGEAGRFASDCALRAGSFGMWGGSLALSGGFGGRGGEPTDHAALRGALRETDGWRDHSNARIANGSGSVTVGGTGLRWRADASLLDTDRDNPGTLTADQMAADPEQPETRDDYDQATRWITSLTALSPAGQANSWSIGPYARFEDVDQVRTLFFQPLFHHTSGWTAGGQAQWSAPVRGAMVANAMVQGEGSQLDSRYNAFTPGVGDGATSADGSSWRSGYAASGGLKAPLGEHTIGRANLRFDAVTVHAEDHLADTTSDDRTMSAVSPMLGVTHQLNEHANVYASVGTAFRVPTLYQLFDRRPITVAPGVDVSISNNQLDPQRSTSVEFGARYDGIAGGTLAVTAYSSWVKNEIDFDLGTLQYANINKSWHRGLEGQWTAVGPRAVTLQVSGAWTPTTFRGGEHDEKQINGVPETSGYAAIGWSPLPQGSVELGARMAGRQFLDKDEQHPLAAYASWEAGLTARVGRVRGSLRVLNLFDFKYADTGFIGAFGEERFSPAAPRSFTAAVTFD